MYPLYYFTLTVKSVLKIKEFADMCGCSIHTLRYYDQMDLLKPKEVNLSSGYRYYTEDQLNRYIEIKEFQGIGFTVQEIQNLKHLSDKEIAELILEKVNYLSDNLEKSKILMQKYINRKIE